VSQFVISHNSFSCCLLLPRKHSLLAWPWRPRRLALGAVPPMQEAQVPAICISFVNTVCTQAKDHTNHVTGSRVSPSPPPTRVPEDPFPMPAMRGAHKARDSPVQDQVAEETPLPPSGNSGRSGLRRDGDGDPKDPAPPAWTPRSLGSLPPPPPAPRCGETRGCGRGGTGGSGGDKGQELGAPAAALPRPVTKGTSGVALAATLLQTPGPSPCQQPLIAQVTNPPTLTIPDCQVSCCPHLLLGTVVMLQERYRKYD
jgi:hypothetical protein